MKNRNLRRPTGSLVNLRIRATVSRLAGPKFRMAAVLANACFAFTAHGAELRTDRINQVTQTFRDVTVQPAQVVEDLGDIRPLADQSLLRRIRFTTSLYGEFVSNARATGNHSSGDFLFVPSGSAALDQPLGQGFSLDFNARSEAFLYAENDDLSFWGFSGSVIGRYQPTNEWPKLYVGIEPYWYTNIHNGDRANGLVSGSRITSAVAVSAGIEKDWAFNRDQTVLFVGYGYSHFFSSPASDNRTSHRATIGVTQQLRPSLFGQLFYSYQWLDYTDIRRRDSRNFVGLNLVYQIDERWSAKLSTYLVDNNSSQSVSSYQTFGVGLTAACQF